MTGRKKGISTQSAKGKGREFQKAVRDMIYERNPELQEGDVESKPMGSGGVDIMLSPYAREFIPLSIECKSTRATPGTPELEQAASNCYKDTLPVVVWKPFRASPGDARVMVRLDDLLDFLRTRFDT